MTKGPATTKSAERTPAMQPQQQPEAEHGEAGDLALFATPPTHAAPNDTLNRRAHVLNDPRLNSGVRQRAVLMRQFQRSVGNSGVGALLQRREATPEIQPVQREQGHEQGGEDRKPTEAEKLAAKQAALAAEQLASASKAKGADQVSQVTAAKAGEQALGQAAKQQAGSAKGAAKAAAEQGKAAKQAALIAGKAAKGLPVLAPAAPSVVGPEPGKAPAGAEQDVGFQGVVTKLKGVASKTKAHPAAKSKADAAQAAAESPAAELAGQGQHAQAGKMEAAEAPPFDKAAFKAKLMEKIAALAPKTAKAADEFKQSNALGGVKGEMQGSVAEEQQQSVGPTNAATTADPATNPTTPKPVTPLQPEEAGAPPSGIGGTAAAPKPKTASEIEQPLQADAKNLDQQMAEGDIDDKQLKESNEPEFQAAVDAKGEAKEQAATSAQGYRQAEQGQIAQAQGEAAEISASQAHDMHQGKAGVLKNITAKQKTTKSKDEQERAAVGQHIQGIYQETKASVTAKLGGMDAKVNTAFDTGSAAAKKTFEDYVDAKMNAFKEDRYGGWFGWARWAKDKIAGMPSEVNAFYTEGRALYLKEMDAVIDRVATIVVTTLSEARAEVARGRQRIQEYVAGLSPKLKSVGAEAAEQTQSQFDELESSINNKLDETINSLATKYNENLKAVDARIDELKAANQGFIQKAANAIAGVIKTIMQLKDMLLGVLARAASVIGTIIKHPIQFLGNLISGVKQGLMQFVDNIGTHLKNGLMTWLFGELAAGGIEIPKSFDMQGILTLVLQVLGLTWQSIRAQAVKILGEPVVKTLEGAFDIFMIIKDKGLGGLWDFIKDKLSDLKDMVIDGIKDMVATEVIKAGIQWLVGMLGGPAGAFIKAAKAIIDIVMWFVNNGSRVLALVNSVLDSVSAIASGSLGQAANFIEQSLAKAVPIMIGFLASLLGLGNLGSKIKAIIEKIQAPVKKAIGWVLGKAKGFAAKAMGGLKALGGKAKGALGIKEETPAQKEKRLQTGVASGVAAVNKFAQKRVGELLLKPLLAGIRLRYRLAVLEPVKQNKKWAVHGEIQRITALTDADVEPPIKAEGDTLLVGEGDFGFATGLAGRTDPATGAKITATSYESLEEVQKKYALAKKNIADLKSKYNVEVKGNIDARALHTSPGIGVLDTIIFNFPHTGSRQIRSNQQLLNGFFKSAKQVLKPGGKIYVTLKFTPYYKGWHIEKQASDHGLSLVKASPGTFEELAKAYPGYEHRETLGDRSAEINEIVTYVFS